MKTKEELIKEVARLTQTNNEWSSGDETRRKNLSKMLDAPTKQSYGLTERTTYSWPEIYFELGKIKTEVGLGSVWSNLREIDSRLISIEKDFCEDTNHG